MDVLRCLQKVFENPCVEIEVTCNGSVGLFHSSLFFFRLPSSMVSSGHFECPSHTVRIVCLECGFQALPLLCRLHVARESC